MIIICLAMTVQANAIVILFDYLRNGDFDIWYLTTSCVRASQVNVLSCLLPSQRSLHFLLFPIVHQRCRYNFLCLSVISTYLQTIAIGIIGCCMCMEALLQKLSCCYCFSLAVASMLHFLWVEFSIEHYNHFISFS